MATTDLDTCSGDADCTPCLWAPAPTDPSECPGFFNCCGGFSATKKRCESNRAGWDASCPGQSPQDRPCPCIPLCEGETAISCVGGRCMPRIVGIAALSMYHLAYAGRWQEFVVLTVDDCSHNVTIESLEPCADSIQIEDRVQGTCSSCDGKRSNLRVLVLPRDAHTVVAVSQGSSCPHARHLRRREPNRSNSVVAG